MSGHCAPSHQNTPLQLTALSTDTVEVTDPTHPLYGLTFPLIGMTTKPRLGRVCIVRLSPGVERVIPVAATSLGGNPTAPSPCRLSVDGLHALLAVVASWASHPQEKASVASACLRHSAPPTARPPVASVGPIPSPSVSRTSADAPAPAVDEPVCHDADAGTSDDPAPPTGGIA